MQGEGCCWRKDGASRVPARTEENNRACVLSHSLTGLGAPSLIHSQPGAPRLHREHPWEAPPGIIWKSQMHSLASGH